MTDAIVQLITFLATGGMDVVGTVALIGVLWYLITGRLTSSKTVDTRIDDKESEIQSHKELSENWRNAYLEERDTNSVIQEANAEALSELTKSMKHYIDSLPEAGEDDDRSRR